jgi:sulfite exporter TauE/SafE
MANGLLPCGLVYAAAIGAAGFGRLDAGLLFLAGFWAGTVPPLLISGVSGGALGRIRLFNNRKAAALALAAVGVLLIVRGAMPAHGHGSAPTTTIHAHGANAVD